MRRFVFALLGTLMTASSGCVVHDHKDASEPIWWPTFVLHESTLQPQGGHVQVHPTWTVFPPAEPHLREPYSQQQ